MANIPEHGPDIGQPPIRVAPLKIVGDNMILKQIPIQIRLDTRLEKPAMLDEDPAVRADYVDQVDRPDIGVGGAPSPISHKIVEGLGRIVVFHEKPPAITYLVAKIGAA